MKTGERNAAQEVARRALQRVQEAPTWTGTWKEAVDLSRVDPSTMTPAQERQFAALVLWLRELDGVHVTDTGVRSMFAIGDDAWG